jgi:hypothetical protein
MVSLGSEVSVLLFRRAEVMQYQDLINQTSSLRNQSHHPANHATLVFGQYFVTIATFVK